MQVEYLPQARLDIAQAIDYLANNLTASQAAEDLLDEFDSVIQNISEFPYAFPLYQTAEPMRSEVLPLCGTMWFTTSFWRIGCRSVGFYTENRAWRSIPYENIARIIVKQET